MSKTHYRTCHLCETMCGIEVEYDGEQIQSIRGDKKDVLSQGNICPKATGLQDIHTDPDRLRQPMIRRRKNPSHKSEDDQWETVSWNDALEFAAQGLAKIQREKGHNAVASYCGRSVAHNIGALLSIEPLRRILGSRNTFTGSTVDQMPHNFVWHHMLGHQFFGTVPDINRTNFYLMIGTNPKISNGAMMSTGANTYKKFNDIRERGGKTILIDPRRNESAKYMDEHHFIRPNTDALFLIGLIKTVFSKGLATAGHLTQHIKGWDKIESLIQTFELPPIAEITGIPSADIERIAVEFANADGAICYGRTGVSMVEFGGLCQWLMQVLNIVTGNLDRVGGMMFPNTAIDSLSLSASSWDSYRSRVSGRPEFSGEFPMAIMHEEILTPGEEQIRGLIATAGNMVLSMADGKRSEEALQDLEFMVSIDFYLNETTRFADVILPPVGPFEKSHYDLYYHLYDTINWSKYAPALFEPEIPEGEVNAYTDYEIGIELLSRLASHRTDSKLRKRLYRTLAGWARKHLTVERIIALGLRFGPYGKGLNPFKRNALSLKKLKQNPHGVFLGELQPCLPDRLFTKDKKIDLAPQVLLDDIPRLRQRFLSDPTHNTLFAGEAVDGLDLQLISRLTNRTLGWMHHSYRLVKGKNPCVLLMHHSDAQQRQLQDQQLVALSSVRGTIELPLELTDDIMPGVVCMPHLWGHNRPGTRQRTANATPGVSMNDITNIDVIDELTGNAVVNGVPVKVTAAVEPQHQTAHNTEHHPDELVEEFVR
ncbi:MAG: dehydrogenase [Cellvibrionaceae bacterium]|nr:dehydrogenase [Cellvibrionaceae bacterium]